MAEDVKVEFAYDEMREMMKGVLHRGVVTVTFIKKGTDSIREMICTLSERYLPERPVVDENAPEKTRVSNKDLCVVYDLEREDWRSFRYDSVIAVKTISGVYTPTNTGEIEFTQWEG